MVQIKSQESTDKHRNMLLSVRQTFSIEQSVLEFNLTKTNSDWNWQWRQKKGYFIKTLKQQICDYDMTVVLMDYCSEQYKDNR